MSGPYFPPEIFDSVINLLHDNPDALKQCCLVSKSWISRTRKHLFAEVSIDAEQHLESWKAMFQDPSTSPAHFAESLHVACARAVTTADAEPGGWLTGFAHIRHLGVETRELYPGEPLVSLVPFHVFSPIIKSLSLKSVALPPPWIFNFILSSPLLEDLVVAGYGTSVDDGDGSDDPSTASNPPVFTGSLELPLETGMSLIASRLLTMPSGIHFRKLTLKCYHEEDLLSTMALVGKCSHTIESLNVTCNSCAESLSTSVDLSKATRLKDLTFRIDSSHTKWVTRALRTITANHRDLQQISISPAYYSTIVMFGANPRQDIGEQMLGQWLELDRLLRQIWESYSIPPKILCYALSCKEEATRMFVGRLLPETTGGGTINLVNAQ